MPTALMLSLRPHEAATVAPHLGRAAHAAFLHALTERDAALSKTLHDLDAVKPFTVSDLLGARGGGDGRSVSPNHTYGLRWTGLSSELDEHLRAWAMTPPTELDLDGTHFTVESATTDPKVQAWAGSASWNDLIALEQVGRVVPSHHLHIHFWSPTTFRSSGRSIPVPQPELVFGSLLDRWNSVAPLALPVEIRRFAAECLVFGRYSLEASWLSIFGAGETAFTGRCTYTATNRDRYYLHVCAALLRLGFFSGVGAKTSMGFGMMRTGE
ncbi:MAG: CRISPR-associated endoribonuclease Cas6 [Herpetosiphonaceae bacterium]|nr:CRISPR-associated endoribonuclease Cas6 [Herpetosiphonaceae bacterium]